MNTGMTKAIVFCTLILSVSCSTKHHECDIKKHDKFEIQVPVFPEKQFSIADYDAVSDGLTLNNKAFSDAIAACASAGGGKVIVPEGLWLVSSIEMKSNINLHLKKGALVLFSTNFDDYQLISTYYEGKKEDRVKPLIYCNELKNIAITGEGIIDGSGQVWRQVKKFKMTEPDWKELVESGGVLEKDGKAWWPNAEAYEASQNPDYYRSDALTIEQKEKYKVFFRPQLLQIVKCEVVLLEGVTFQNSPAWNIHPLMTKHLTVKNVNVRNPWYAQNGDGIDIESCQYVNVINSRFDVGDDGICLKSGKNEEGRKRGIPSSYIYIDNCVVYHGHGGFVVGSEMSGGVNNVWVNNCSFLGTDVGLRFKSTRGRGGVVENIFISNIRMINIPRDAVIFDLYYNNKGPADDLQANESPVEEVIPEVTEETPAFRNIFIKNVVCNGALRAMQLNGLPEMPLENLVFENVTIKAKFGVSLLNTTKTKFENVKIISDNEPAMVIKNSGQLVIEQFEAENQNIWFDIYGSRTDTIQIVSDYENIAEKIKTDLKVDKDKVVIRKKD